MVYTAIHFLREDASMVLWLGGINPVSMVLSSHNEFYNLT